MVTAVSGSSFAVNVLLSGTLSLLWGLINSIQLLVAHSLINLRYPANIWQYIIRLHELANLEVLPTEDIEDYYAEQFDNMVQYEEQGNHEENPFDLADHLSESMIEAGFVEARLIKSNT